MVRFFLLSFLLHCMGVSSDKDNYYSILKVRNDATSEEIKQSYRQLAKLYHPDKNSDPDAPERFHAISEAYENLGSDSARAKYDASLSGRYNAGHPQRSGFHSFQTRQYEYQDIRSLFNDMQRAKRSHRGGGGSFYYSASFSATSFGYSELLKLFLVFTLFWVCSLWCLVQCCCSGGTSSEDKEDPSPVLEEAKNKEIPPFSYSMKLQKGFVIVSCNERTKLILQNLNDKGRFKNDPVTFAHKVTNKDLRGMDGEVYGAILVCLKGTKWAGHTIIDSDVETWTEKVLCGEVPLTHVDVCPCPI